MKNFLLGFVLAAVVMTGGYLGYKRWSGKEIATAPKTRYHCPMHPTYISDKPGDCPICGMKLVPIEPSSESTAHPGNDAEQPSNVPGYASVTIPQNRIQSMGITIKRAERMNLDQSFRTYGRVTYDETQVHQIHTRFEGYIEELFANYTGQYVKKGAPLFSVYSPELYATQNEYLLALRAQQKRPKTDSGSPVGDAIDLAAAARERLALWNIGETEIRELERTGKPTRSVVIYSPVSGYVASKTAVQGLKVAPADNLYEIIDLSVVWVQADVYESNLRFIKIGQSASMTLEYRPGKTWHGKVAFIDPTVDPATRTTKARIEFANPDGELKPEMYGQVVIGGLIANGIAVPDDAVIATGERIIVFVAKGDGVFEPREVTLGARVRNLYEIKKGIVEGENVVTGANFLLDSESKLKAATKSENSR